MRHIALLSTFFLSALAQGAFAQDVEPTEPTEDEPEIPSPLRRVTFDHYWELLGRWSRGEDLKPADIERLDGVSDIIFNEINRHPRLRYLNRLGSTGYAAYARAVYDGRQEILKLEVVTNPSEAMDPGAIEAPSNSTTEASSRSDAAGENRSSGGWGPEPVRDSSATNPPQRR